MSKETKVCVVCYDNESSSDNGLLICNNCFNAYHQKCHKPLISDDLLYKDIEWMCRLCLYKLIANEGDADLVLRLKTTFPYDLESLTWDSEHRVNEQNTYCYCGAPGNFYSQMLQCRRCWQWFHAECISTLQHRLLYGDHYYLFTCRVCNNDGEVLRRIGMDLNSMVAIVLNNLSLTEDAVFFGVEEHIIPFLKDHCQYFELDFNWRNLTEQQLIDRITKVLRSDHRFKSSTSLDINTKYWALIRYPTDHGLLFHPNKFQFQTINESMKKANCKVLSLAYKLKEKALMAANDENVPHSLSNGECPRNSNTVEQHWNSSTKQRIDSPPKLNGRKTSCCEALLVEKEVTIVVVKAKRGRPVKRKKVECSSSQKESSERLLNGTTDGLEISSQQINGTVSGSKREQSITPERKSKKMRFNDNNENERKNSVVKTSNGDHVKHIELNTAEPSRVLRSTRSKLSQCIPF
ncbi:metal-response element-binding transcription factor 2-like protein [Leptotrombidium deliense]|uniref:Metal-response element-binding transcription factor 2-like protein n=1 Tax=Leptotrombidium deliense TaxID=299467 RepID=A0A443SEG7_9ACAR|nr:metal-response element-binding transcription factor 2-like protein [Leptotrombidium deliense]